MLQALDKYKIFDSCQTNLNTNIGSKILRQSVVKSVNVNG